MNNYSLKVTTQNLSKTFFYYENDNLNFEQAKNKLKQALKKFEDFKIKGIEPVVYDDRNRAIKVTNIEIVKNMANRLDVRKTGNSVPQDAKPIKSKGSAESVSPGVKLSALESQSAVKDMASVAPIDRENVNRIKDAIKRGEYPIDLDRVSDALMEAYKEMKT